MKRVKKVKNSVDLTNPGLQSGGHTVHLTNPGLQSGGHTVHLTNPGLQSGGADPPMQEPATFNLQPSLPDMGRFTTAIVRLPSPEMVHGITTTKLGKPDFAKALEQHHKYVKALESCGLQVRILESDSRFPDSVFIEDVALCTPGCAVITNPGVASRKGETAGMRDVLSYYYQDIEEIHPPGTLEAGDVMMVGNHFYIGLSERTNRQGAGQLIAILDRYGMSGSMVPLKEVLHLKTGVNYLENSNLLVCGEFIDYSGFRDFNRIEVPAHEAYSANSLWINGTVLVPMGFPVTQAIIEEAGYPVIVVDVSEFQKLDGGLSCLSLRLCTDAK